MDRWPLGDPDPFRDGFYALLVASLITWGYILSTI